MLLPFKQKPKIIVSLSNLNIKLSYKLNEILFYYTIYYSTFNKGKNLIVLFENWEL